jgi:2-C-methyl-D-erythritol 4-phosphate cytidylyltransferase
VGAIVGAAGAGRRLADGGPPKQFRRVGGVPILARALRPFLDHSEIESVIAVLPAEVVASPPDWLAALPVTLVAGGAERSDSVRGGLASLEPEVSTVLVHDGARPFVTRDLIDRVLAAARSYPDAAVIPGERLTDTVKEVGTDGVVMRTVPRDSLRRVQTPQAFPRDALDRYHDPMNLKVTTSADLLIAEALASDPDRVSNRHPADESPVGDGGGGGTRT